MENLEFIVDKCVITVESEKGIKELSIDFQKFPSHKTWHNKKIGDFIFKVNGEKCKIIKIVGEKTKEKPLDPDDGLGREPNGNPTGSKSQIESLLEKLEKYKMGTTFKGWKMDNVYDFFENEYIKVMRIDSSNNWSDIPYHSEMEKMWSIIIEYKKDFCRLDNYKILSKHLNMQISYVSKGNLKGCYGIRIYGMKKDPTHAIIYDILKYIFD